MNSNATKPLKFIGYLLSKMLKRLNFKLPIIGKEIYGLVGLNFKVIFSFALTIVKEEVRWPIVCCKQEN